MKATFALFWFASTALALAGAASTPKAALLVLSKGDHTLAIVDPASLAVIAKMPVGEDPHEVIASADGTRAYVSNYGSGAYHTLAVLDLVRQKALSSVDLGPMRGPHGLAVWGGEVWFTAEAAKAIGRYDPAKNIVDWILGTGQNRTHMLAISADGQHIYTTNVSSGTVTVIDKTIQTTGSRPPGPPPPGSPSDNRPRGPNRPPGPDWNETVIPVGQGAEGFDISPDARQLWTANAADGTVSIIDLDRKQVVETVQANVPTANRLKFTPDGEHVLISLLGGSDLIVLDSRTHREIKRVSLGAGAAGIQMEPGGARAYVACTGGNYVAVVDLKTFTVIGKIDAGPAPDGLAWALQSQAKTAGLQ